MGNKHVSGGLILILHGCLVTLPGIEVGKEFIRVLRVV